MATDYVLGNDREELNRLELQHKLWRDDLLRLWKMAHFEQSQKILDLGCGPGFTTLDLAQFIEGDCEITAVDLSDAFLAHLKTQAQSIPQNKKIYTHKTFIEELQLSHQNYDAAFCRWLMIFVQDPEKAIFKIASHIKPKARFVLQEYVTYDSMDLVPDFKMMKPIVEAIFKSWKDQGGDPNRGQVLPALLEKNGFEVLTIEPVAKFARPKDPLWAWPDSFYKSFLPRLQKNNYLSEKQVQDFFIEWEQAKTTVGAYFIAPTVINIIAQKK